MATDDVDGFWTAVAHLPADRFDATEIRRLRAWLAARRGEAAVEERELTALVQDAPGTPGPSSGWPSWRPGRADPRGGATPPPQGRGRPHPAPVRLLLEAAPSTPAGPSAGQARGRTRPHVRRPGVGDRRRGRTPGPASVRGGVVPGPRADRRCRRNSWRRPRRCRRDSRSRSIEPRRTAHARRSPRRPPRPRGAADDPIGPVGSGAARPRRAARGDGGIRRRRRRRPASASPSTTAGPRASAARDDVGRRGPARLRRRRLARRLLRPGRSPARGDGGPGRDAAVPGDRLFRNRGDGTFQDVTERSGIAAIAWGRGYGMGVAVGDYDNDGRPRPVRDPDCAYTRSTATAATGPSRTPPAAAGLAGHAATSHLGRVRRPRRRRRPRPLRLPLHALGPGPSAALPERAAASTFYCDPRKVEPAPDHVFRNDGGRFVDVTAPAGLRRVGRARARRRRRRPRRRQSHRPLRRQRRHGQLPVPQQGRLPVRGRRAGGRGGRQRRGRLPGRHGRGLRRPRRRRPARPAGDQLLRRGDHALPGTWARASSPTAARPRASAWRRATCWASASRWPTSPTTAGPTS